MEDFTSLPRDLSHLEITKKTRPVTNEYGGIFDKPKNPKVGFIKARMNKDNFWNLMFALMFFIGLTFGFIVPQPLGGIMFWIFTIGAILLVKYNSHLTFDKEKLEFTTSQDFKIKKYGVMFIGLLLVSAALATGIISLFSDVNLKNSLLSEFFLTFFWAFFPSLYCILRNFPIAVYFKKEAWIGDGSKNSYRSSGMNNAFDSTKTSMSYDYLPSNMWHSSYLDRHRR